MPQRFVTKLVDALAYFTFLLIWFSCMIGGFCSLTRRILFLNYLVIFEFLYRKQKRISFNPKKKKKIMCVHVFCFNVLIVTVEM